MTPEDEYLFQEELEIIKKEEATTEIKEYVSEKHSRDKDDVQARLPKYRGIGRVRSHLSYGSLKKGEPKQIARKLKFEDNKAEKRRKRIFPKSKSLLKKVQRKVFLQQHGREALVEKLNEARSAEGEIIKNFDSGLKVGQNSSYKVHKCVQINEIEKQDLNIDKSVNQPIQNPPFVKEL